MTMTRPDSKRNAHKLRFGAALAAVALLVTLTLARAASAQTETAPPPTSVEYLQYGVALHTLTLLDAGDVCPGDPSKCILGSGGGLGLRVGFRSRGPLYLGTSFQLSRLNSSNLLRFATLQRLTFDGRYYLDRGNRLTPYLQAGVGGAIFGNEFSATTGGIALSLGFGLEYQISERTVVTLLPSYQPVLLRRFTDALDRTLADGPLGFGLAHWLAVQVVIEARDPLSRW
jgi:opacity protein-like surface antigen